MSPAQDEVTHARFRKALERLIPAVENYLSSDPQMLSFRRDEIEFEEALADAKALLEEP